RIDGGRRSGRRPTTPSGRRRRALSPCRDSRIPVAGGVTCFGHVRPRPSRTCHERSSTRSRRARSRDGRPPAKCARKRYSRSVIAESAPLADAARDEASADPRWRVLELLRRHGWNTTSFQVLERGFAYWFHPDLDACVAYVDTGRAWVAAGAPIAGVEDAS